MGTTPPMNLPLPKGIQKRLEPLAERGATFLKTWEWSWTKAVAVALVFSFIVFTTLAVVPSWFLYYADQTLRWRTRLMVTIRDAITMGWITTWFVAFLVAGAVLQNLRRKLRGESGDSRPTGGYR
jgi:hypothetical protein